MTQHSLFDSPYRDGPGFKKAGPAAVAAESVAKRTESISDRCYRAVIAAGSWGMTPDEAAELLSLDKGDTRPRFTELSQQTAKHEPLIRDTGTTRPSARGKPQTVWVAI